MGYPDVNRMRRPRRNVAYLFSGEIFRQLKVNRTGPLLSRNTKRLAHDGWNGCRADNLACHFGERHHARYDIYDLKSCLLAAQYAFLAGNQDHRHGAKKGVSGSGREIKSSWSQSAHAAARIACEPSIGRGHKSRGLLVSRHNELDF